MVFFFFKDRRKNVKIDVSLFLILFLSFFFSLLDPDSSPQGLLLDENSSERFESRFVTVKINKSPSIMLEGMEGTVFGVWLAHGEGKSLSPHSLPFIIYLYLHIFP